MNSKRDNLIIQLEKSVFNNSSYHDNLQKEINEEEKEIKEKIADNKSFRESESNKIVIQDNEEYNKNENEIENKINTNNNINYENINEIKNEEENENKNEKEEKIENIENKINNQNISIDNNNNSEQKLIEKKLSGKQKNIVTNDTNINSYTNQTSENNKKDQSSIIGTMVSPDLITKMMKQLKEQNTKLILLENQVKAISKNNKNLESHLNNHILDNESEIQLINDRINSLLQKNEEYDQKIDNLQVKASELDVFSILKDSGGGTIDATKIMVKALEEKIFKKFELVDARYKKDSSDNLKMKTNVENITPKLGQFQRELERISDINKQVKEDLDNYKKENEEQNLDSMNTMNNDIKRKLSELKDELEKNLKNKILSLENQLKNIKTANSENNTFDLLKLGLGNNGLDSEAAQALEKKINDLRKKTNDLENTLKLHMDKKEIDDIKKEIKDMKFILDKKITKDDLKELYNFHLSGVDEINDMKDRQSITNDELRKTVKDLQNLQQRVESLSGNLALLQNTPSSGNAKIIDFSKYIDNQKLTETLKPFLKEFEKLYKEMDSFRRDISDIDSQGKNYTKKIFGKIRI